jgi:2-oxoisovalerate dehydrogenase E2 component (dihydrolipoyl transacylase)
MICGGLVVPRQVMNLSSSFDHHVLDGHVTALFVRALRRLLETPALLFFD